MIDRCIVALYMLCARRVLLYIVYVDDWWALVDMLLGVVVR